jgi:hypothetical protein
MFLTLVKEITAVYSENHKNKHTMWAKTTVLMLKEFYLPVCFKELTSFHTWSSDSCVTARYNPTELTQRVVLITTAPFVTPLIHSVHVWINITSCSEGAVAM